MAVLEVNSQYCSAGLTAGGKPAMDRRGAQIEAASVNVTSPRSAHSHPLNRDAVRVAEAPHT